MFLYARLASFIIWHDRPVINPDATTTHKHTHTPVQASMQLVAAVNSDHCVCCQINQEKQ